MLGVSDHRLRRQLADPLNLGVWTRGGKQRSAKWATGIPPVAFSFAANVLTNRRPSV